MEVVIKTRPKRKITITRDKHSGIIRVNEEACRILEGIANELEYDASICTIASALIKAAAEGNIIREEREVDE